MHRFQFHCRFFIWKHKVLYSRAANIREKTYLLSQRNISEESEWRVTLQLSCFRVVRHSSHPDPNSTVPCRILHLRMTSLPELKADYTPRTMVSGSFLALLRPLSMLLLKIASISPDSTTHRYNEGLLTVRPAQFSRLLEFSPCTLDDDDDDEKLSNSAETDISPSN